MKVVVIGGTEFMGRETVRRLVARGHEVSVLHRREHHDLGPEVRNLQADRGDLERVARMLGEQPYELVFDFAYDDPASGGASAAVDLSTRWRSSPRHLLPGSSSVAQRRLVG